MPSCIKCGEDAGSGSVLCEACDDRPKVTVAADRERRSTWTGTRRSDNHRSASDSSASNLETVNESTQSASNDDSGMPFFGKVVIGVGLVLTILGWFVMEASVGGGDFRTPIGGLLSIAGMGLLALMAFLWILYVVWNRIERFLSDAGLDINPAGQGNDSGESRRK